MIFDIILVVIFLLMIIIGAHRGAIKSLAGIIASVIAYLAAAALGAMAANAAYDSLIRPAVNDAISQSLSNIGTDAAGSVLDSMPKWISGLLDVSGADFSKMMEQPIAAVGDTVTQAVDTAIRPLAIGILTICITIILFLLLFIILRFLIAKPLNALFRVPVLNGINRFFGGVIGAVEAFLLVSMAAYLIKLILTHSGTRFGWFSESTIFNSFIFYHFYSGNIFTWISSLLTG